MTSTLPDSIKVIERGWLSSNNILCLDGKSATLIDSGYVSEANETVALVEKTLDGRHLTQILNTHAHSDHIGGNLAVQAAFGCSITVPEGSMSIIAEWDEEALLLGPLGQCAARFCHDDIYADGDIFDLGGFNWHTLAVSGHDMAALALYNPEKRLLISGDALWENGFGVIFPELLGSADGLKSTRETLEKLARLPIDVVIPGHGPPFGDVDKAFERAFRRLDNFERNIDLMARHALKVVFVFIMLKKRQLRRSEMPEFLENLPFAHSVNSRILHCNNDLLAEWLVSDLCRSGALKEENGWLLAG